MAKRTLVDKHAKKTWKQMLLKTLKQAIKVSLHALELGNIWKVAGQLGEKKVWWKELTEGRELYFSGAK